MQAEVSLASLVQSSQAGGFLETKPWQKLPGGTTGDPAGRLYQDLRSVMPESLQPPGFQSLTPLSILNFSRQEYWSG